MSRHLFLKGLLCLLASSWAQAQGGNFSSAGCVDPDGFNACNLGVIDWTASCLNGTRDTRAIEACGCKNYVDTINCVATSCWNRVYGCEYQQLIDGYFDYCSIARDPIPFWPTPDNAPGGCSCNLAKILRVASNSSAATSKCRDRVESSITPANAVQASGNYSACSCCGESATISAHQQICPDTDPSFTGLKRRLQIFDAGAYPFATCTGPLQSVDCASDLGFLPPTEGGKFYRPDDFPEFGTKSVSDMSGSVTSPLSGATFTWTENGAGVTYTVTAKGYQEGKAAGTTAGGTVATGSRTAEATSGSGASTQSTGTSSGSASPAGATSKGVKSVIGVTAWVAGFVTAGCSLL